MIKPHRYHLIMFFKQNHQIIYRHLKINWMEVQQKIHKVVAVTIAAKENVDYLSQYLHRMIVKKCRLFVLPAHFSHKIVKMKLIHLQQMFVANLKRVIHLIFRHQHRKNVIFHTVIKQMILIFIVSIVLRFVFHRCNGDFFK